MLPEVRREMMLENRKRGCAGMNRPLTATGHDHLPPLLCGTDAMVWRLAYGWYLGAVPRKDLIAAMGIS